MTLPKRYGEVANPDPEHAARYRCIICDVIVAIDRDEDEGTIDTVCNPCIIESDANLVTYRLLHGYSA